MEAKRFVTVEDVKNMFTESYPKPRDPDQVAPGMALAGGRPDSEGHLSVQPRPFRLPIAVERTCNLPVCFCSIEKAKEGR